MNLGILMILIANVLWAAEIIIVKKFFPTTNPLFLSSITSIIGSFFYLPMLLVVKDRTSFANWPILIILGFGSFFLAQILYITGIQKNPNVFVSIFSTLTYYLSAIVLGFIFFKEMLTIKIILGGLIMIVGFLILSL